MSLLWALLFRVQFPFHWLTTFLYIQPKNHSEETLLYVGQWEGDRKLKARMRRKIQKQVSYYWKDQEQRKVLFFSHMWKWIQWLLVCFQVCYRKLWFLLWGRMTAMNSCYVIICNCSELQSVSYSPQHYDPQMLSSPWSPVWWICNSYFMSPRRSVFSLHLSEIAFKVPY